MNELKHLWQINAVNKERSSYIITLRNKETPKQTNKN